MSAERCQSALEREGCEVTLILPAYPVVLRKLLQSDTHVTGSARGLRSADREQDRLGRFSGDHFAGHESQDDPGGPGGIF